MTRCDRCDIPSPDDPDASANGGVSVVDVDGEALCLACADAALGAGVAAVLPEGREEGE